MRVEKLIIQNFRAYHGYYEIPIFRLNVFVGKNDIGKSTLFEALDIVLDGGLIKFDKEDICKIKNDKEEVILGVEFSSVPEDMVIDSTAMTSLKDELLLLEEGKLIFLLKGKNSATLKPFIRTMFPKLPKYKKILDKNLNELKALIEELKVDKAEFPYDERIKSSIRKAIRLHFLKYGKHGLDLVKQDVSIEKEDGKSVYEQIKKFFPTYALFQSDRKNEDQDKEAQDPLKAATKEILDTMQEKLSDIQAQVKDYVETVAKVTLDKLRDMNPELADKLIPEFSKTPDWSSVFKYSLKTNDDIPLNKRGSGIKRMILLNFYRAKAEKVLYDKLKKEEKNVQDIIYAFEEPETSQHPNHQKLLIESFVEMSGTNNIQVLFTTHSPEVAKLISPDNINLIHKKDDDLEIEKGNDEIYNLIANELGVLPSIELTNISRVKVAICVEGKNDIEFLQNINQNIPELRSIVDLSSEEFILLPLGGSTLQYWVNRNYLEKLKLAQIHIYDSDVGASQEHKYKKYVDVINSKIDNSVAFETHFREFENYIHPKLINEVYKMNLKLDEEWKTKDIALKIVESNHEKSDSTVPWSEALEKKDKIKEKTGKVKNQLNGEHAKEMTKELFESLSVWTEVRNWFEQIKKLSEG